MTPTDAELRAYLSGDASAPVLTKIEELAAQDDVVAARLAALDPLAGPVRQAFAGMPSASRLPDIPAPNQQTAGGTPMRFAACLAVGIALGGLGFWSLQETPQAPDWQVAVAQYQALYGPETIAPLTSDPASLATQFARASDALGRQLDPVGLAAAVPELSLKRAQVLHYEGDALIQIVFADQAGRPIAFCLLRDDELDDQTWTTAELSGLQSATHHADGLGVMLVGDGPASTITEWAKTLSEAI